MPTVSKIFRAGQILMHTPNVNLVQILMNLQQNLHKFVYIKFVFCMSGPLIQPVYVKSNDIFKLKRMNSPFFSKLPLVHCKLNLYNMLRVLGASNIYFNYTSKYLQLPVII